jgi:hypothetical protein
MNKLLLIGLFVFTGCGVTSSSAPVETRTPETARQNLPTVPLSQIDLSKIGAVTPKGRVQDRDYNNLAVVENLIAHGTEAVPFLIGKLDDQTLVKDHVFDYWYDVRIGDVAFVILTDFFTDATWRKTTIPGVGYDTFLERRNPNITAEQVLRNYIARHGRNEITKRWRVIWAQYKARVCWDGNERCLIAGPLTTLPNSACTGAARFVSYDAVLFLDCS